MADEFPTVFREELIAIGRRRGHDVAGDDMADPPEGATLEELRRTALDAHLAGLAFSGGGIRSATFAVGVIQGLASLRLLGRFDIISSVSGGGYASGWLAAWNRREGDPANVEKQLDVNRVKEADAQRVGVPPGQLKVFDQEPEPVHHLRAYASYLTPRPGLLTADTWTLLAIIGRNALINLLMLGPLVLVWVFVVRLVAWINTVMLTIPFEAEARAQAGRGLDPVAAVAFGTIAFLMILAGLLLFLNAFRVNKRALDLVRDLTGGRGGPDGKRVIAEVVIPLLAASTLLSMALPPLLRLVGLALMTEPAPNSAMPAANSAMKEARDWLSQSAFVSLPVMAAFAAVFGLSVWGLTRRSAGASGIMADPRTLQRSAFCAGAAGGLLLAVDLQLLAALFSRTALFTTLAPPLGLVVVCISIVTFVALCRREIGQAEREWWARLMAYLGIAGLSWAVVVGSVLLLPAVLLGAGAWLRAALAGGYLATIAAALLTRLGGRRSGGGDDRGGPGIGLGMVIAVVPPLFVVGTLGAAGLLGSYLLGDPWRYAVEPAKDFWGAANRYFDGFLPLGLDQFYREVGRLLYLAFWLVGTYLAYRFTSRFVDVNLFSLQEMYANRLVRTFLGASRPKRTDGSGLRLGTRTGVDWNSDDPFASLREPNPVTGFDPADDLPLGELVLRDGGKYWGPNLLFNTSLALVAGQELAWRDRKAASFVLSPLWCGSELTGYARTPLPPDLARLAALRKGAQDSEAAGRLKTAMNLSLGRAVATSGAAVDPNMATYQSSALTAMLTAFNARLGIWVENPGRFKGFTLHAIPLWTDPVKLPESGKSLIVVATVDGRLHVRIFDHQGERIVDTDAARLQSDASPAVNELRIQRIDRVKRELESLHELRREEHDGKRRVIRDVAALVAPRHPDRFERYDVLAMPPSDDPGDLPASGKSLIVGATVNDQLHLRVFDQQGERIIDTAEARLLSGINEADRGRHESLIGEITAGLSSLHELRWREVGRSRHVIRAVVSLVEPWKAESPASSWLLLNELKGETDEKGDYVHLTDGGHFENLGVYELIRRRCRYVVAVDAGEDASASDENLSNLIRLVRIDFGIRIEIAPTDVGELPGDGPVPLSRSHVAVGTIHYEDVDQGQRPGILVYLKISLTGDEPPDLLNYAASGVGFPHQSTGDQFFDEVQFECYRALGDHVARRTFEEAAVELTRAGLRDAGGERHAARANLRLFAAMQRRWAERPVGQDQDYLDTTAIYLRWTRDLLKDDSRAWLLAQLYPEWARDEQGPAAEPPDRLREIQAVDQMVTILEDTWIKLNLGRHDDLPMNRGWLNTFRRWTTIPSFRRCWPVLRSGYSTDFVKFCEDESAGLVPPPCLITPLALDADGKPSGPAPGFADLAAEFHREWPNARLDDWTRGAAAAAVDGLAGRTSWVVALPAGGDGEPIPVGLVLIRAVAPGTSELLVWIRNAHRGMGYGGEALRGSVLHLKTLDALKAAGVEELRASYPSLMERGGGGRRERADWADFLGFHDFRAIDGKDLTNINAELVLALHLPTCTPARLA